ncbi:hypothetical protein DFH08DRAFT_1084610 [Mycena albidolilacea]|uniref:Uncharacterized protein n=1 Tax=Mycena albidolilacea TaxID=1033008 RepID=A0AAD6ZLC9_9AGAR|nr:hypothetical protein DFH08DRAFT_1084610 [Mycena albidolilacea]
MRPTPTALLLAAATLIGLTTISIPHSVTANRTAGCGTTTGSTKVLVDPNGVGGAWAGANYSEATFPEGLQFVSDLLDVIRAGWWIDNSRGLSIGGGFVNTIACAPIGGNFGASPPALVPSSFYTDNGGVSGQRGPCTRGRTPLPVPEIHGGSDTDVLYAGGAEEGGTEPAIVEGESLSRWATRNGCTGANMTEMLFSGDVHHSSWACAGVGVEEASVLRHWKDDMRHCWPSTSLDFSEIAAG